jgi:hypothetical protein
MKTQVYIPTLTTTTDAATPLERLTNVLAFVLLILGAIALNVGAAVLTGLLAGWLW